MTISNHGNTVLATPAQTHGDSLSLRKLALTSQSKPDFDFIEFFSGHTRAIGWFSDRFGRPRRHFSGDFHGVLLGDKLNLHEELKFTDGITEERLWRVGVSDEGAFSAESDTLIGSAVGRVQGDTLQMKYRMSVLIETGRYWELNMEDTMILQSDGCVHNITHVFKWGVKIGSVSAVYLRNNG